MTGNKGSTIVATVLSVLFVAIVGVVAMVFVAIFVYRKKKSKKVVLQHTAFSNPVYEGNELQQTWHKIAIVFVCLFICLLIMPRCYFFLHRQTSF